MPRMREQNQIFFDNGADAECVAAVAVDEDGALPQRVVCEPAFDFDMEPLLLLVELNVRRRDLSFSRSMVMEG